MTQSRKTLVSFLLGAAFLVGSAVLLKHFFGETDLDGLEGTEIAKSADQDADEKGGEPRRQKGTAADASAKEDAAAPSRSANETPKKSGHRIRGKVSVPTGTDLGKAEVSVVARGDSDRPRTGDMVAVMRSVFGKEAPIATAVPSSDGTYLVDDLPPGRYTVRASAPGCVPDFTRDIVVNDRIRERNVDFLLAKGTVVQGTVRSAEGTPIKDAMVRIVFTASTDRDAAEFDGVTARTNAAGEYAIVAPEVSGKNILCMAEGFAGYFKDDFEPVDGRIDIVLARGGRIEGRVLSADRSEGIADAIVFCVFESKRSGECMVEAKTRADGTFALEHVDGSGKSLSFVIEAKGFSLAGSTADGAKQRGPTLRWAKEVPEGQTVAVDFKMQRLAEASGTVVDLDTKEPLRGAVVALTTSGKFNFGSSERTPSDANGAFTIVGIPPGASTVTVELDGYFAVDGSGKSIDAVAIHEGSEPSKDPNVLPIDGRKIELFLRRGRVVAGVVVTPDRKPVVGAEVKIAGNNGNPSKRKTSAASVFSGDDGTFRFLGLPFEHQTLVATHPEFAVPGTARIGAGKDEVRGVEVVVAKGSTIEGEVKERGGAGIPEIVVSVAVLGVGEKPELLGRAAKQSMRTDAGGRFRFDGLAGGGKVELTANDPRRVVTPIVKSTVSDLGDEPLHVVIEMAKAVAIKGVVVDASDVPLGGLMVSAFAQGRAENSGEGALSTAATNAKGEFTLNGFPPDLTVDIRVSGQTRKKRESDGREIPVPVKGEALNIAVGQDGLRVVVAEVLPK